MPRLCARACPDMDIVSVTAGAATGFVVGLTGVGGGALMTPILLLAFGVQPLTAVGTDVWFAAITKVVVSGLHVRDRIIDWRIAGRLWLGSLPAALLTVVFIAQRSSDVAAIAFLRQAIGVALLVTASSLIVRARPAAEPLTDKVAPAKYERMFTIAAGAILGFLVALTSIGAGALGAVFLFRLYPQRLAPVRRLVATDVAHAIPLSICAGIGHLAIGHVDFGLLRDLLVGSVPAALAGAVLSARLSHPLLGRILGMILLLTALTLFAAPL